MVGVSGDDVYGALLADALAGRRATEVVERSDGFVMTFDSMYLLAPFEAWEDANERAAMRFVRGHVLDVGCGGGRVCLYLQERGLNVVGIDSSPGAIACCRERGVRDVRWGTIESLDLDDGSFDTIVMLGQNFGMFRSASYARRLLRRFARLTTARGRIVAETFDPHGPGDPTQVRYLEQNVARGRMPGQQRVRERYGPLSTGWFDWLQVSREELTELLDGSAWRLSSTIGDGPSYVAIIDKRS